MKKESLIEAIGNIDEKKIERAGKRMEMESREKRGFAGWRIALVAACFAGIVAVVALPIMSKKAPSIPQSDVVPGSSVSEGQKVGEESEKQNGVMNQYTATIDNIVINRDTAAHTGSLYLPKDYIKREEYSKMKMSGDAWTQITECFEAEIGISYENFGSNLPESWKLSEFYGVTVRSYTNSTPALDKYVLSDYGLSYSGGGEKAAFVSVSSKENPFLTYYYNFEPFKDLVSTINSIPMIIVENNSLYHASFKAGDLSYYVAFVECTQEEVAEFLRGLVTFSVAVNESDIGEVYAEAITADMLTAKTEDVFCGAYIDGSDYIVLLTDVSDENIDTVCAEFGIDKNTAGFKEAEYTLSYLTEVHEKITEKMMTGEIPFVVTCGVYEIENRVVASVLEGASEDEKEQLLMLDTLGGAIAFETTEAVSTELLATFG